MRLDAFYPIVDSANWIERFLPLGIKQVQLRIKNCNKATIRNEIRKAKILCQRHNCTLIVNDYWQIAIEEGCPFIHLGQEDLADADLQVIRRAGLRIGLSSHDKAELKKALSVEPDYIALGPIYPTILKKMKWRPQGLERLTEWKQLVGKIPLVAIGGMKVELINEIFEAGADIIAVVTDITFNKDPESRVSQWIAATREMRK